MYSGDINQDDYIDPYDFSVLQNDIFNFSFGYLASDINGDGYTDPYDFTLFQKNSLELVMAVPAVGPAVINSIDCANVTNSGNLVQGVVADSVSITVSYTGGNGGYYGPQSITSTGVAGLTASLSSGNVADGSGNITLIISGVPASSGLANFTMNIFGQSCSASLLVQSASITSLNCSASTNSGTLVEGVSASGVSSSIHYTGGNGGAYPAQTIISNGLSGLSANLAAGNLLNGIGSLTYTISGTPSSYGTAYFPINFLGQACTLVHVINPSSILGLNCAGAIKYGKLIVGSVALGVNSVIPYSGGNGGAYSAQSIPSTGVAGLVANLPPGRFANGSGNLTFSISGTPTSAGTANFVISIGGQSCTLSQTVLATVSGISTATCGATGVLNPAKTYGTLSDQDGNFYRTIIIGGQEWMAENLKASHYRNGDLIPLVNDGTVWQGLTTGASCWYNNDSVTYSCPFGKLYNWYAVADTRNLCPINWHVPTDSDWKILIKYLDNTADTNISGTTPSASSIAGGMLKSTGSNYWLYNNAYATNSSGFSGLPGGFRSYNNGAPFSYLGLFGYWWSATQYSSTEAWYLDVYTGNAAAYRDNNFSLRGGFSVRCIKD
jgi:uncharacterized protein (TIGR02145 family)